MRRSAIVCLIALTVVLAGATPSAADYLGKSVTGSLVLAGVPTAFTSGATATIADPGTEFSFTGDQFNLAANFSGARGTTLELEFVRTGSFGEAPNATWVFSGLNCVADAGCTILRVEDIGGSLTVQSITITGPQSFEIATAATSGGPANYGHTFQVVTSYDPIRRTGWVPNVGALANHERPIGDLWTFTCKPGQRVSILVDTKDGNDDNRSLLDPFVQVLDGAGQLLAANDDGSPCTYPPVCGYACPRLVDVACGAAKTHAIIVRDSGPGNSADPCNRGGGYELEVLVREANGAAVPEKKVALGGAPAGKVPAWISPDKKTHGPALDDEGLPFF